MEQELDGTFNVIFGAIYEAYVYVPAKHIIFKYIERCGITSVIPNESKKKEQFKKSTAFTVYNFIP